MARNTLLAVSLLLLAACSSGHTLVDTPNVYVGGQGYPADEIPTALQTSVANILYVTDRKADQDKEGNLTYKAERSTSMVVGNARVQYGKNISWEALKTASQSAKRAEKIKITVADRRELVRFPATPIPFGMEGGKLVSLEPGASNYAKAESDFQDIVKNRLAAANRKEVVLFVHGFNNTFDDAGLSLADVWHFTGRVGVPIFYTWPAASGGLFGYFKDREAGEFTIFHLKETLRMLSRVEGLENIHIIAHSRGTDITTSALRELVIEARAAGHDPRQKYKIANLFLAAPDLDFGVVRQRLIAERFGPAIGQVTVYMNQSDGALGFAQFLMAGLRFGRLAHENLGEAEREIFNRVRNVNFVSVEGVSGFVGHSYFREHAGALSDIAMAIRHKAKPGDANRPLVSDGGNFWILGKDYLLDE